MELQAGEAILLYTDGVNEASDAPSVRFPEWRLEELLGQIKDQNPR